MSLNLGTKACEALKQLQGDPRWTEVRNGVAEALRKAMDNALNVMPADAAAATAYTRALRDVHVAFSAASDGVAQQAVPKQLPAGGRP